MTHMLDLVRDILLWIPALLPRDCSDRPMSRGACLLALMRTHSSIYESVRADDHRDSVLLQYIPFTIRNARLFDKEKHALFARNLHCFDYGITDDQLIGMLSTKRGASHRLHTLVVARCTKLTSSIFRHIDGVRALCMAHCTQFTDESMALLPRSLHVLSIDWCKQSTGAGVQHLEHLRALHMSHCAKVTDQSVQDFKHLELLCIDGCSRITDAPLARIGRGLRVLSMQGCRGITDAGVEHVVSTIHMIYIGFADHITIKHRLSDKGVIASPEKADMLHEWEWHGAAAVAPGLRGVEAKRQPPKAAIATGTARALAQLDTDGVRQHCGDGCCGRNELETRRVAAK